MYWNAVRRGWWIVLASVAAALVVAAIAMAAMEPVYRAGTLVAVTPSASVTDAGDVLKSLETLERRTVIATFARVPGTPESREAVSLREGIDAKTLRAYRVSGSVLPSTNIIRISVEGPDPAVAAQFANALATQTAAQARSMYRIYTMRVLEAAAPDDDPIRPDRRRNYLVAVAAGLLVGLAAAFSVEHLRSSSTEE
ncbi:MAG TPA: Wzz/FepE/Etk N-terminal domain-containing protein [Thermoanaerobaculia bacterium]|nr:Wzz/FepE/Etk N-terminal domain-containing protein [Thermoanaerobaculia bacterium]